MRELWNTLYGVEVIIQILTDSLERIEQVHILNPEDYVNIGNLIHQIRGDRPRLCYTIPFNYGIVFKEIVSNSGHYQCY